MREFTNLLVDHFSILDLIGGRRRRRHGGHNLVLRPASLRLDTVVSLETVLDHVVLDPETAAAEIAQEWFLSLKRIFKSHQYLTKLKRCLHRRFGKAILIADTISSVAVSKLRDFEKCFENLAGD